MIQNRLLQAFLTDEKINKFYLSYLEHPSAQKKDMIEKLFQIHVRKIQLLSYFSKVLHFESQKYDKKIRHINSDGFPAYEVWRQIDGGTPKLVYFHDPIAEHQTPLSLGFPMEFTGINKWVGYNE
ncbi:DUF3238 domain-containing protein [Lysinibacillus sp. RC79]|uniref:DUF3238 domain-containing protein n=1 Tax=Lysinibacillus sp. RC79 TaxID=3156296 RepID=UPI0035122E04